MARKLALGLKGYSFPQFFDQAYIEQESEPGTNPWLIERNIDTLPLKGCQSGYKSVVKVVAQKEKELAKMKLVLPTIKDMNERQRRREFTCKKKDFLETEFDNSEFKNAKSTIDLGIFSFTKLERSTSLHFLF